MEALQIETYEDMYSKDIVSPTDRKEQKEFNDLAKELGFENLCLDREANPEQIRIPRLNKFECMVYKTVCPTCVSLDSYNEEIPVRALKALKTARHAVPEDWDFYIHKATEDPDPILVAKRWSHDTSRMILIARWGRELIDFPTLAKRAQEIIQDKIRAQVIQMRSFINSFESDPEGYSKGVLNGDLDMPE